MPGIVPVKVPLIMSSIMGMSDFLASFPALCRSWRLFPSSGASHRRGPAGIARGASCANAVEASDDQSREASHQKGCGHHRDAADA